MVPELMDLTHIDMRARATASLSRTPRPFLKWAGSKRGLTTHIVPHLPERYGRYYEPFFGAGSLFFLLEPDRAIVNDACAELIETYRAVIADPEGVIDLALSYEVSEAAYYHVRGNRSSELVARAAEFVYLNHTCYNGLYRVNSSGQFNVPWGRPKSNFILDKENVQACHRALNKPSVTIMCGDFEHAVESAQSGDLVFFDPPNVTGHNNNGFISYNEKIFSWADQVRLARVAADVADRGAHVIVTNANHEDVISLYPGFECFTFSRASTIAGQSAKRGSTSEVILVKRGAHG